jgi:hypothetical protein
MAIDYSIQYTCTPKEKFGVEGILERLKARARAQNVIRLFRENGDTRPPSEMGFELTRSLPDGAEDNRIVIVQDMLDLADELNPYASYCAGCPANALAQPFGCYGQINYPISSQAEAWLLDQLPGTDQPLIWLLLREGTQSNGYDGSAARALRGNESYFEETRVRGRDMIEFVISADQVFEMLFMVGTITPAHAGILLLLFGAIPRNVEAPQVVAIMNGALVAEQIEQHYPFQFVPNEWDDDTIRELKAFFQALYLAWMLGKRVVVDA